MSKLSPARRAALVAAMLADQGLKANDLPYGARLVLAQFINNGSHELQQTPGIQDHFH